MNDSSFSPNLFLFQNYVTEVLKQSKKHIKSSALENIDPQTHVSADKQQYLDLYHQYFLIAMSHPKTREVACINYQKIIKQSLSDREHLPPTMITSIIGAWSNTIVPSSTGSSSLGSSNLGNNQAIYPYMGNLIKTIILETFQSTHEFVQGINYLLEGSRKKHGQYFTTLLEDVYINFLVKFRQPPLKRIISLHLNTLLTEIEVTINSQYQRSYKRGFQPLIFEQKGQYGKFGKCFICAKQAHHYIKTDFTPICSINCKQKVRQLQIQCQSKDNFDLLSWILDNLPFGDLSICNFFYLEMSLLSGKKVLAFQKIQSILKIVIHLINNQSLSKPLLQSLIIIMTQTDNLLTEKITKEQQLKLQNYFKTFYLQIFRILEENVINKNYLEYVYYWISLLKDNKTLINIFLNYDCKFFEISIVSRAFNIISQYSKKESICIEGLQVILKNLINKIVVGNEEYSNLCFNPQEYLKKKELKKVISLFNKKPANGIKHLKKLFQIKQKEQKEQKENIRDSDSSIQNSRISNSSIGLNQNEIEQKLNESGIVEQKIEVSISKIQKHQQSDKKSNNQIKKTAISSQIKTKLTPKQIALFIRQNIQLSTPYSQNKIIQPAMLDKAKVGQYFGGTDEEARFVCKQFIDLINIEKLEIDDVMRLALSYFQLPKQTQQIERIIGTLSTKLDGVYDLKNDTAVFQYIYVLMMVQTSNQNPNIQEKQKLTLQNHLSMCKHVEGGVSQERAMKDFKRIIECPLDVKMKYHGDQIFTKKYISNYQICKDLFEQNEQVILNEDNIKAFENLPRSLLLHIWQYLLIGLLIVGNSRGLCQSIILYGKYGLKQQQNAFYEALRKIGQSKGPSGGQIGNKLLRLSIDYGNYLLGSTWDYVIRIIYYLQNENQYNSTILDRLFTNSSNLVPARLKDFIQALLLFSNSDFKTDVNYNRQLFVLRHINNILEYNLFRFREVVGQIWTIISHYFRDICLHPRKEISMASVDSYKQLTLKIFKIRPQMQERQNLVEFTHESVMQNYLYIFERSNAELKDLIINILVNLICQDMQGGWEVIYNILDILDTTDKEIVVRIISRLIMEIKLERLTQIQKLHAICIKQLRTCGNPKIIEQLLQKIWQISQYINQKQTWLETIRSIKDIYKISLNGDLLIIFVKLVNACLQRYCHKKPFGQQNQQQKELFQNEQVKNVDENKYVCRENIQKELYGEVVEIMMFLIDPKITGQNRILQILLIALEAFEQLQISFVINNLGGSYGFLSVFQMHLSASTSIAFALFLKSYFKNKLIPEVTKTSAIQQLGMWVVSQYYDHMPIELINLRDADSDFNKQMNQIIRDFSEQSKQSKEKNQKKNEQLIQFHLSNKEYYQKSTIHLIFLQIVDALFSQFQTPVLKQKQNIQKLIKKIEQSIIDSYECAVKVNRLVLLRNFLWNNNFLIVNNKTKKNFPGLHKQEHRTLRIILGKFKFQYMYPKLIMLMKCYLQNMKYKQQLQQIQNNLDKKDASPQKIKNSSAKIQEKQISAHETKLTSLYLKDLQFWFSESNKCLVNGLIALKWEILKSSSNHFYQKLDVNGRQREYKTIINLCIELLAVKQLPQKVVFAITGVMHPIYEYLL